MHSFLFVNDFLPRGELTPFLSVLTKLPIICS